MPTPDPLLAEYRTLRHMLGRRAEDIAAAAGVDKSSLSYWECGQRSPHLDKLRAVIEALGFDLALVPTTPDADTATTALIRHATTERDQARTERDRLVDVIAGLMSLPPHTVAAAYGVSYGQPTPTTQPA